MKNLRYLRTALVGGASALALAHPATAKVFDIPDGDLATALDTYMRQSGVQIAYLDNVVRGHRSPGAHGDYTETAALSQVLRGTGFTTRSIAPDIISVVPESARPEAVRLAQAVRRAPSGPAPVMPAAVETVVVTAQKKSENIQNVPIAVTALSQAQLTDRQIAGGPDLLKSVPNMDFTKTNFSGYDIELRGIGTQAISVTTDPAVAVAFNGTPFIRNHFFEQEFFDLQDVEVLLGPQGTLYGRNATAGVVNLKSALPTDSYEAMLSADIGNYSNRRLEAMLNLPIVGDKLDLRIAGEWTKRDGYTQDTTLNTPVDGRDLWSTRVSLRWRPTSDLNINAVWEHFSEDDGRLRSGKQLCKTDPGPNEVDGVPVPGLTSPFAYSAQPYLSQGCLPTSLYSQQAFEVPNGLTLPYYAPLAFEGVPVGASDPYASTTQSTNLRQIQSAILSNYRAKNDTLELNVDYQIDPELTLTSQTGYNHDFLWSTEDYNRFDTAPGAFGVDFSGLQATTAGPNGAVFCDPQLGCSDRLVAQDLDEERAWQLSQEFRLASNFGGPINFSLGGNYLHYETEENYYVFINSLTLAAYTWAHGSYTGSGPQTLPWIPGVSDNSNCLPGGFAPLNFNAPNKLGVEGQTACQYIDPNPMGSLNNQGHNYFLSQNPYVLNSYAGFGEAYYNITPDLKLTGGIRWTDDQKNFIDIPSELLAPGHGYPVSGVVNQSWERFTGRAVLDWTPQLDFTDQTLVYASYAHGYKAGGANPPGAELLVFGITGISTPIHPLTFKPEYIEAFELGTKNTLLDGSLTLNGDIFYYNYTGYQISEIVDRTAINNNYNAHVEGAEVEANWEPLPGLKFNFAGGWEDTAAAGGDSGIDLMDRTAGMPGWMVVKPFVTQASNCILPDYVVAGMLRYNGTSGTTGGVSGACSNAYQYDLDPVTAQPYTANPSYGCSQDTLAGYTCDPYPISGYAGFNPATAPNHGEGFAKNLSGHQLPNAPPFTVSLGGEYSIPMSEDWVATARADFYWQADSWARIFNDNPYDRLRGYDSLNLSLILNSANGWTVMGYVKNVFNVTAITGDFLNSDDSGLTTNVFLTDPRLFGVRVTKQLDQSDGFWGSDYNGYDFFTNLFSDTDNGKPPLWIEVGGQLSQLDNGQETFAPALMNARPSIFSPSQKFEHPPHYSIDEAAKVTFQPENSDWIFTASIRYGRSAANRSVTQQTNPHPHLLHMSFGSGPYTRSAAPIAQKFASTDSQNSQSHNIVDFQAGKDVGLGLFGNKGTSELDFGVRFAQFASKTNIALKSDPDWHFYYKYIPPSLVSALHATNNKFVWRQAMHSNWASFRAKRSFHGIGPSISWKGSAPIADDAADSGWAFDWGLNAAVLFGRQRTTTHHQTTARYGGYRNIAFRTTYFTTTSHGPATPDHARSRNIVVPNLGGFAGVSMRYQNAKISFGYRADEFFGAMDGGIDTRRNENVGFFGPYANISIGLGG